MKKKYRTSSLLTPREVDILLRYPRGRALKLARQGLLPLIILPDGEVRFDLSDIEAALYRGTSDLRPDKEATDANQ